MPTPIVRPPATTAPSSEWPTREAIDSGRAQPLFLSFAGPTRVAANGRIEIVLNAETENDVAQMRVALRYDPAFLHVVAVRQGDFLAQACLKSSFSYALDMRTGEVTVEVAEERDGPPVAGGGSIAIVQFQALRPGHTEVRLHDVSMLDLRDERVAFAPAASYAIRVED